MAAKIRLKKAGRKGQAAYRLVVLDGRKARDAKVTADLGFYDPKTNPPTFEVNGEDALKWLLEGAKPTKAARDILSRAGVMEAWDAAQRGEEIVIQARDVKPTPQKKASSSEEVATPEASSDEEGAAEETPAEETPAEEEAPTAAVADEEESTEPEAAPEEDASPEEEKA